MLSAVLICFVVLFCLPPVGSADSAYWKLDTGFRCSTTETTNVNLFELFGRVLHVCVTLLQYAGSYVARIASQSLSQCLFFGCMLRLYVIMLLVSCLLAFLFAC